MYEEWNQKILKLSETRVWRTYQGGAAIDRWRGKEKVESGSFPEDWVASTTTATNPGREDIVEGLSKVSNIPGEPSLKDVMEAQPENYFGKAHLDLLGATAGMLIKLIDAEERLTIQTHPDKKFAKEMFQSDYGKTESWYILDANPVDGEEPCVYFGFKPHVTREVWKDVFDRQDIPAMLDCLHKIPVKTGDSFFIPGGLPHAIGAGCFLAEVQEPTDYTMRTELTTPKGLKIHETLCHQGCGVEKMLDCFHYEGVSLEETQSKWMSTPKTIQESPHGKVESLIDDRFTDLFTMQTISATGELEISFSGQLKTWIVLKGEGSMTTPVETMDIKQGDFLLLPASLTQGTLKGNGIEIIECLPKQAKA